MCFICKLEKKMFMGRTKNTFFYTVLIAEEHQTGLH